MNLNSRIARRDLLRLAAAGAACGAAWVAGVRPGEAGEARIAKLIEQTRDVAPLAKRIGVISAALRGTRYQGYTLIGSPRRPERFVLRDDAFDCMTYCETVLAAALSRDMAGFEDKLREIRYRHGIVNWFERNHYFFEWSEHNIENKTCRAIDMDGAVTIEKTVYWHHALGRRHFEMRVIPRAVFAANKAMLETGDIIGFITRRPNLDYFHIGFVVVGADGELLLRHAALSRGRVLDESMNRFLAYNGVHYVTLLRPLERPAA